MKKHSKRIATLVKAVLVILVVGFFTIPIFYFLLTSLKPEEDMWNFTSTKINLDNYVRILFTGIRNAPPAEIFYQPLMNSVMIGGTATLATVILALFASYSIARFHYRGREDIAFFLLTLYMAPPIASLVPLWNMAQAFNLLDNHFYLILLYSYFGIPLAVWLLRSFMMSIPVALEEAAMVDGVTRLGALLKITVPLLKPGIVATAILTFIFNWNEFLFSSTLTATVAKTIPVTIAQYGFWLVIDWGTMSAMGILAMAPVIILSLFVQKYIVSGLTLGAVRE